jgi:hypothetical protein
MAWHCHRDTMPYTGVRPNPTSTWTSGGCNATANGESCDTCIFCDDGSVEADCTNIERGRKVECGDIFVQNFTSTSYTFFPFLVEKAMGSTCEVGPDAEKTWAALVANSVSWMKEFVTQRWDFTLVCVPPSLLFALWFIFPSGKLLWICTLWLTCDVRLMHHSCM